MEKITPFLWYDGEALTAAEFYVSLLPDSRIDHIEKSAADNPSVNKGDVLVVEFTLAGRRYAALNGGPHFKFTEAVSLQVLCDSQEEIDRLWNAFTSDGGEESMCGWCKDRWGLSWQITPRRYMELMKSADRNAAERIMQSMMTRRKMDIAALEAAAKGA